MDQPSARRIHDRPIPRLGGMAIVIGFLLPALWFLPGDPAARGLIAGAVLIAALGMADDILGMQPAVKFLGQVACACVPVAAASRFGSVLAAVPESASAPTAAASRFGSVLAPVPSGCSTPVPLASIPGLVSAAVPVIRTTPTPSATSAGSVTAAVKVPSNPCRMGDLDCNGIVDGADLGTMLSNWGNPGATDLDGNGVTNGADLGIQLAQWGTGA